MGRNKELAPNNIKKVNKKAPAVKKAVKKVAKTTKTKETKVKKQQTTTTPEKKIRGVSLYRFTESARTLRSQVEKVPETIIATPPRKT